jgi:hypothetical protein
VVTSTAYVDSDAAVAAVAAVAAAAAAVAAWLHIVLVFLLLFVLQLQHVQLGPHQLLAVGC